MRDFFERGRGRHAWAEGGRPEGFGGRGHGRFGGPGGRGRGFGHGGLRLVLLKLIQDKPSHGYELIKAIEDHFNGRYAPSPGIVYPALSWLEDGGFITIAVDADGRKVATITEAGTALLQERAADVDGFFHQTERPEGTDFAPVFRAMDNLKGALRNRAGKPLAKAELENIVDWIDELARRIERS